MVVDFEIIGFSLLLLLPIYSFRSFLASSLRPTQVVGETFGETFALLSSHYTYPWCILGFVECLDYQRIVVLFNDTTP
jgi:hypothetical protein